MIMSDSEKDEYIRKTFATDLAMARAEDVEVQIKNDIDTSNIKIKRYTYVERRLMGVMAVLLVISLASNAYLLLNRNVLPSTKPMQSDTEYVPQNIIPDATDLIDRMENVVINDTEDGEDEENPDEEPEVTDPEDEETEASEETEDEQESKPENKVDPEVTKPAPVVVPDKTTNSEVDEKVVKEELTSYAATIGRYGDDATVQEKNTILLLIANNYFNNKVSKNTGLEIGSKNQYAMTADNVHLFIKELMGLRVDGHLDSFINYMKYNETSKFYSAGSDLKNLKDEKYEVTSMKIETKSSGEFNVVGTINRKSTMEVQDKNKVRTVNLDANYSFEALMEENSDYTYIQYQIKDFKTELRPGDEDNVVRLLNAEQLEEQEANKKKR